MISTLLTRRNNLFGILNDNERIFTFRDKVNKPRLCKSWSNGRRNEDGSFIDEAKQMSDVCGFSSAWCAMQKGNPLASFLSQRISEPVVEGQYVIVVIAL